MDDNVIGIAFADLSAADLGLGQASLLNQGGSAEATRVLEQPARGLEAQRLARLALDPGLAHALDERAGVVAVQLELGAEDHRVIEVAPVVGEAQLLAFADLG